MKIRVATLGELDTVIRLREDMKRELGARGLDQWQDDYPDRHTMIDGFAEDLAAGHTWFAEHHGQVVGMVTANTATAADLWTPTEVAESLFVHRLTRAVDSPIRGVGRLLLAHVDHLAAARGRTWLRLDAWTTNTELHAYYLRQGFRYVGTVAGHHTPSAARFERPVLLDADTPDGHVTETREASREAT